MKNLPIYCSVLALALCLTGCQPKASANQGGGTTTAEKQGEPAAPKMPDALKSDGYYYYGLDNTKPLTYTVTEGNEKPMEGVQTVQLKSADKDASFTISRTGALTSMGDEDLIVKSDGVYLVRSNWGPVEPAMLSFPAKATEGFSWKTASTMKGQDDRTMTLECTWTIGKGEKVKTEAGEFDTVKVTGEGNLSVDTEKHPLNAEGWYSKQVGAVKLIVKSKDDKGKEKSSVVELKKVG
ncbi:MAG: hypothetical protein JSS65_06525 [Armatimonadetes bacterium]|nr:hypothetical protein [Armatimonadota bacterium]